MTFIPTLDTDSKQRPRIPRTLDPVEVRALGSLMEKQLATPEYYPLTLNALVAACNQKSNREPVMELAEDEVERALNRLQDERLVWRVMGGRAVRWDHNLDTVWHLNRREKAVITLLFLRGPQTAGELRGRSDRLHQFETVAEVEDTLRDMAAHSEPLVRQLSRRPGQKEERWAHLAGGAVVDVAPSAPAEVAASHEPLSARVARLEEQVASLISELRELKSKLGE
ncbi:MAG TPA: YceH family protein [Thermoanaerobaculia bacterium]|nr:YceH family protein [Thermoanaerobaculia bacterium]